MATGVPPMALSPGTREAQSSAFLVAAGIDRLYSGVKNTSPSAAATVAFSAVTDGGSPAASTSAL